MRLAIDYRRLNAQSVEQTYHIASITEAFTSLSENAIFSTVDGQNAFMSIQMHEESKNITGIATTLGSYIFIRIPFGLSGATMTYSRAIDKTIQ